ncbi:MAG TPA: YicC/YloC family endoribonuclease [Bosea sp. (in: a-proteobacteria)]|uniref:YicC/YloC family endoribonuclease n=1 Tax=Bosea sp. (in: a-proteobacteria) TaxID=1871050 RepID=UPI002DDD6E67|nr:YicC/YloC family endoribonuclease [Bosea sp. (in: a-proteobacteria)]HEV2556245.1 YicC/YloC family endoribonuclease [Bosea sp. (in: a-proteobacteria)]
MAIESMTGFARAAGTVGIHAWAWEIRSVNGRGLDIRVRVPPGLEVLAEAARKRLTGAFSRGTLHVNLQVTSDAGPPRPRINEAALAALLQAVERLPASAIVTPPSYDGLLSIRGVIELAEEGEDTLTAVEKPVLGGLEEVVSGLKEARASEGRALEAVLRGHLDAIARLTTEAETHPARGVDAIRERIAGQVALLLEASQALDPQRLHQEAAMLAVKADIREEIDRLQAHVAALRLLLDQGGPIGRKLDFLSQEFGREASTLCAKAGDAGLSRIGLELRTVVDQMREQVQNVE